MKYILRLALFAALASTNLWAHEIATIGGHPDARLEFGQRIIKDYESYTNDNATAAEYGSHMYSILDRRGVSGAVSYQILFPNGNSTSALVMRSFKDAVKNAGIVLFAMGPKDLTLCNFMSAQKDTAFVVVAEMNAPYTCKADNIVAVVGLNSDLKTVPDYGRSNPDMLPEVAAPAMNIRVIGNGGYVERVSNQMVSTAFVAADMAAVAKQFPTLKGAALVAKFYETKTVSEPGLDGFVVAGRRLVDDGE